MTSVLDRSALEQSPLADLHLLADELGVDGFRRLRRPELIDAIIARQSGEERVERGVVEPEVEVEVVFDLAEPETVEAVPSAEADAEDERKRSRRGRRGGRGRARREEGDGAGDGALVDDDEPVAGTPDHGERGDERVVEGAVELLANGSGFLRLAPPDPTENDVYISAAQVKRCELVSGDRVSGPSRAARRSERFPSLIRVDTINGRPADEVAEGTRFEDLPVAWPDERIELGSDDSTVKAIEWLTPFGKGSRVVIAGPARSGKSEALRRLAEALAARPELELSSVLIGVRPEEIADWQAGAVVPGTALTFSASVDAQAQAVEQAVEQGRRVAARGGDAVVLIDSLEYLSPAAARRVLASARNLAGGGSLTVIATAPAPVGGETTVVALDRRAAALGNFPALALGESGTLRPELLVGDAGADAIRAAGADGVPSLAVDPEPAEAATLEPAGEAELVVAAALASEAELEPAPELASEAELEPAPKLAAKRKPAAKRKRAPKKKPSPPNDELAG